jgi:hypothetical protein
MSENVGSELHGPCLLAEVERYLAAVDAFRAVGSEPRWLPEPVSAEIPAARRRGRRLPNGLQERTT